MAKHPGSIVMIINPFLLLLIIKKKQKNLSFQAIEMPLFIA